MTRPPRSTRPLSATHLSRRGSVLIGVVIALIVVQLAVVGVVMLGAQEQQRTDLRLRGAQAQYAADAGAAMALGEVFNNADLDGDGTIGTISNDSLLANDPSIGGAQVTVAPVSAASGRKFAVQARCGNASRASELWIQGNGSSAPIEGFEPYALGLALYDVGGWAPWDANPGAVAYASNTYARSGAMSCDIQPPTDNVHQYTATSGLWTYTAWQYIPSSATGGGPYFILMNTYVSGGAKAWSAQVYFDLNSNILYDNLSGGVTGNILSIVRDQWVPIVVTMDLTAGTQTFTYNNQLLFTGSWNRLGGVLAFAAVDLFGNGVSHVYYDDIQLSPGGSTSSVLTEWTPLAPAP